MNYKYFVEQIKLINNERNKRSAIDRANHFEYSKQLFNHDDNIGNFDPINNSKHKRHVIDSNTSWISSWKQNKNKPTMHTTQNRIMDIIITELFRSRQTSYMLPKESWVISKSYLACYKSSLHSFLKPRITLRVPHERVNSLPEKIKSNTSSIGFQRTQEL